MKLTIGVIGDLPAAFDEETLTRLERPGRAIAERDCVLIAEARPGIPSSVIQGARAAGGMMVGISPARATVGRLDRHRDPLDDIDILVSSESGPAGCETETIRSSDIVVIATGCSGTAASLTAPFNEGRPIGVLTRSHGIADAFEALVRACARRPESAVLCDDDPVRLVDRLIECHPDRTRRAPSPVPSADEAGSSGRGGRVAWTPPSHS